MFVWKCIGSSQASSASHCSPSMIDSSESTCPNTSAAKPKPDFEKINLKGKLIIKQLLEGEELTYTEGFAVLKLIKILSQFQDLNGLEDQGLIFKGIIESEAELIVRTEKFIRVVNSNHNHWVCTGWIRNR